MESLTPTARQNPDSGILRMHTPGLEARCSHTSAPLLLRSTTSSTDKYKIIFVALTDIQTIICYALQCATTTTTQMKLLTLEHCGKSCYEINA